MHSSSSTSSTDPAHCQRQVTAAVRHAAADTVANEEEQASGVPGSPPRMLEHRENAGLIEGSGMEVDDAQDNSPSRGKKRKRDLPADMNERHSPPKFRRVARDDGQALPSACEAAVFEEAACSQLSVDADGPEDTAEEDKASMAGPTMAIDALVRDGVPLDRDDEGNAPLHLAAHNGNTEAVRTLLALGAQVDQPDDDGDTPLHLAALNGHVEAMALLLNAGAQVDRPDDDGDTPLHLAVYDGTIEAVRLLLTAGARIDCVNGEGSTPLHLAVLKGHAKAMALLLNAGAQVNQLDGTGDMPLHRASFKGHTKAVDMLLRAGAQVNQPSHEGNTCLHLASFKGHAEVVALLLDAGAQVGQPGGKGNMPLHRAARSGNTETVRLLLAHGANTDHLNDERNAPLHLATIYEHAEVVALLLAAGAQVDQADGDGDTAMHLAASTGDIDTLSVLLAAGARIDSVNREGSTALHLATSEGHADVVDLLLKAGANAQVYQCDDAGNTPLSLAFANGHTDAAWLLVRARTKITCSNLAAGPPGPYKNMISGASLVDDELLRALEIAISDKNAPMVELSLGHGVMSLPDKPLALVSPAAFPFSLPAPVPSPIHDLLLCGPAAAPTSLAVAPEMMDTLVLMFEACSLAQMTPEEIDDALREAGLLGPVVDELAGQFWQAPQLKQAMAGDLPLAQAQIRQAIAGMLGELEQFAINWPQPYQAPERRLALAPDASRTDAPVPWLSQEGQAHLSSSLDRQLQALSALGRQAEADGPAEGISDLLALCVASMPVQSDANAAALRHALTAALGLYGSLADRTVAAWKATLAMQSQDSAACASTLKTFAQQLQAQLGGTATYSQVLRSSGIKEAAAQVMTQLMLRQWTMLEQYWKGVSAQAGQ